MFLSTLTWVHTAIALVGLATGLVVLHGLLNSRRQDGWTAIFLTTTVLTSVTGFFFPFDRFLPSHWVGVISLVVLAVAIPARYVFGLSGAWRWVYAVGAMLAFYLNFFVGVVQAFLKVPALNALAPTQAEAPFVVAQTIVLVIFAALTIAAAVKFHPGTVAGAMGQRR